MDDDDNGRRSIGILLRSPCEPDGSGELINHKKYHYESMLRTRQIQQDARQLEMHESNNITENLK